MVSDLDLQLLQRMQLFDRLSKEEVRQIAASAKVRRFDKGELLFEQGDEARHFFAVLSGRVKIYRSTPQGEQAVIGVFGPGETFAEAAMFVAQRYPATGETIEESRLCLFERDAFETRIAANPQIALGMLGAISYHLHHMVLQVEQLKTRNAEQRLVDFLLGLCKTDSGPCRITLPYEKSLVAARLGMRPESLSRNFAHLAGFGVHVNGEEVAIDNVEELAEQFADAPLRRRSNSVH
jgi:CRP-like cAMP-binding protein